MERIIMIKQVKDVLPLIGEIGLFQCILDVMFFLINIPIAIQQMNSIVTTLPPTWKCAGNSSLCVWNGTFSADDMRRCSLPRTEWNYVENKDFSLITSFNVDCHKEWILQIVTSIFFVGWGIGSLFFGWISDNYGRKNILFISLTVVLCTGFFNAFANSLFVFATCRFITGFFFASVILQPFVIITELVGSRYRPFAGMFFYSSNPLAWSLMTLISYYVNNWRTLMILCTAPYIFMVAFYKFTPESIQWQYEHGKIDEVKSTVLRIAKWNKKEIPFELEFLTHKKESIKRSTPVDLFRTRPVAFSTIAQSLMWFCAAMGYIGTMMSVNNLGGSIYTNFVLINLGAVFALFLGPYFCMRFGRKRTLIACLLSASMICICNGFIPSKMIVLRIVFGMIGKNFVDMGYQAVYIWSSELFPTKIRSEGLGFVEICSRLGSAGSPWVANYLRHFGTWLPFVVMGTFLSMGALVGLYLPETKENENENEKSMDSSSKHITVVGVINQTLTADL